MRPKGTENLAAFSSRKVKKSSSIGMRKDRVFLCRRTVKVKVKSKVIPTSFLKIKGRGTFVETEKLRKGDSQWN